ncbi:MAG: hypothetical protein FJ100_10755 [Deltaproteobacteria bacterium]|nr:hypothetical protein [Deltaproteobacteria bacterium]
MTTSPSDRAGQLPAWTLAALLVGQALTGWIIALWPDIGPFGVYNRAVAQVFWRTDSVPAGFATYRAWIWAVTGGTLAAWSVACAWLAAVPLRRGERWAGHAIWTSLAVWFPVDTGMSMALGNWPNVWLNVGSLAVLVAALVWAWPKRT